MPVKRRADKRRLTPEAELAAWEGVFQCGTDYFGDLRDIGVDASAYGIAARKITQEAWQRLGTLYLRSDPKANDGGSPWALTEFGEPNAC